MKILSDGSMQGKTFSGENYKGGYPSPKEGEETYKEYYERCQVFKQNGFHLGDLSWNDWQTYLYGSPGVVVNMYKPILLATYQIMNGYKLISNKYEHKQSRKNTSNH